MAEKLLAKGEKGQHQCDSCLKLFDWVGNGEWIPTTCPDCQKKYLCPGLDNWVDFLSIELGLKIKK